MKCLLGPPSFQPLHILHQNVLEELGQLVLLPQLQNVAISLCCWGAPPPEVTHPVGPMLLLLQVRRSASGPQPTLTLMGCFQSAPLSFGLVPAQVPASPKWEVGPRDEPSLQGRYEDLNGSAFTARRLPPAEVLHGIRTTLVPVGSRVRL